MKIIYSSSGGFTGQGVFCDCEVRTAELPSQTAQKVEGWIKDVDFFNIGRHPHRPDNWTPSPCNVTFSIRITDSKGEGKENTYYYNVEDRLPNEIWQLHEWLKLRSRGDLESTKTEVIEGKASPHEQEPAPVVVKGEGAKSGLDLKTMALGLGALGCLVWVF